MTQSFWDEVPGKARGDHPDTSKAAALAVMPKVGTARQRVLFAIHEKRSTDEEIADRLGMNPSTERPCRVELQEMGWIEPSGDVRRTRSGSAAIVWQLTDLGQERFDEEIVSNVDTGGYL